jgi:hypothetical protein
VDKSEKLIVRRYLRACNNYYANTTGYVKRIPTHSDPLTSEYREASLALLDLLGPEEVRIYMRIPTMMEDEGRHAFIGRFTEDEWEDYLSRNNYFSPACYYSVGV